MEAVEYVCRQEGCGGLRVKVKINPLQGRHLEEWMERASKFPTHVPTRPTMSVWSYGRWYDLGDPNQRATAKLKVNYAR